MMKICRCRRTRYIMNLTFDKLTPNLMHYGFNSIHDNPIFVCHFDSTLWIGVWVKFEWSSFRHVIPVWVLLKGSVVLNLVKIV